MAVNKRGIDTTGMTAAEKGIAHWGYNPGDGNGHASGLLGRCLQAFKAGASQVSEKVKNNQEQVRLARTEIVPSDTRARKVLAKVGVYYGR